MKTNFTVKNNTQTNTHVKDDTEDNSNKKLTQTEFEEFIIKSGAKGSFMVYRSDKKDHEMGIDEL